MENPGGRFENGKYSHSARTLRRRVVRDGSHDREGCDDEQGEGEGKKVAAVEAPVCHLSCTCIINDCCGFSPSNCFPTEQSAEVEQPQDIWNSPYQFRNRPKLHIPRGNLDFSAA